MKPPPQVLRARRVVRALAGLDGPALAPDLDPGLARHCLALALAPLTVEALCEATACAAPQRLPESVGIVAARGVFTAPIEWAAMYLVAGLRVHLKAPEADPAPCGGLAAALAEAGLPVTVGTDRDLSGLEALVVFGDDRSGAQIAAAWPRARVQVFGHRVSAALVEVPEDAHARAALARALAWDVVLYDTRGCMAPTAVFACGDAEALAADLDRVLAAPPFPRAPLDPALGPEWRRRIALARALGTARVGPAHAVLHLPAAHYLPAALPRMCAVHPLDLSALDLSALDGVPLSSLAVQGAPTLHAAAAALAPRICAPGALQAPPFPRRHDGVDMMGCVLRPEPC